MFALPIIASLSSTMQIFAWMYTCSVVKTFPRNFAQLRSEKTEMWSAGWREGVNPKIQSRRSFPTHIDALLPQPTED